MDKHFIMLPQQRPGLLEGLVGPLAVELGHLGPEQLGRHQRKQLRHRKLNQDVWLVRVSSGSNIGSGDNSPDAPATADADINGDSGEHDDAQLNGAHATSDDDKFHDTSELVMTAFEDENGEDAKDAMAKLQGLKLDFDASDVIFWFSQIEMHMATAGTKKQWSKRLILQRHLPQYVWDETKDLLRKTEPQAGDSTYKDLKTRVIRLFGPKEDELFEKAAALTMTSKPSALAKKLSDLLCKCAKPLSGDCCTAVNVAGMGCGSSSCPPSSRLPSLAAPSPRTWRPFWTTQTPSMPRCRAPLSL